MLEKKGIAVGIDDFERIIERNCYFVDKTPFLKLLLQRNEDAALLLTRPRRFGKSLTMSMLVHFLAITNYEDPNDLSKNQKLFEGLEISKDKEFCQQYMGKFPIIFLSLKNISGLKFEDALAMLVANIFNLYKKYRVLVEKKLFSPFLAEDFMDIYQKLRYMGQNNGEYSATDLKTIKNALVDLTSILSEHFGQKVIVIIDEYDVPVEKARHKFYDEMLDIIRDMLGNTLKSNSSVFKGFLTGCLRITKESVFTGWNNFKVYDLNNLKYAKLFGFTEDEVKEILKYYKFEDKFVDIKEWYDGYRFNNIEIYNPWSVLQFVQDLVDDRDIEPQSYWINSSSNALINEFISGTTPTTYDEFEILLQGGTIQKQLNLTMNYSNLDKGDSDAFWSMLYLTGYLTTAEKVKNNIYTLRIPNKEIMDCFKDRIVDYFAYESEIYKTGSQNLIQYFAQNNAEQVQLELTNLLKNYIGIFDINKTYEYMYHMFLNGIFVASRNLVDNIESFKSNEESGDGRADIKFVVNKPQNIGIVVEIKRADREEQMLPLAKIALEQCKDKEYYRSFIFEQSIKKIYIYGISFYKRSCAVLSSEIQK